VISAEAVDGHEDNIPPLVLRVGAALTGHEGERSGQEEGDTHYEFASGGKLRGV
jgi:hypothetical protein